MNKAFLAIMAVVLLAGIAYWLLSRAPRPATEPGLTGGATGQGGLGASLYPDTAATNPTAKMQETNPFSAPTNPVKGAYTNPF